MKAKELAKFLLENPEAEVVIHKYIGVDIVTEVQSAQLYNKGSHIKEDRFCHSCKTDSIYLSTEQ